MDGRVQLVNSTIHGIHAYRAQVFLLPRSITHMIEKIYNDFIWSLDAQKRSKPKIS